MIISSKNILQPKTSVFFVILLINLTFFHGLNAIAFLTIGFPNMC